MGCSLEVTCLSDKLSYRALQITVTKAHRNSTGGKPDSLPPLPKSHPLSSHTFKSCYEKPGREAGMEGWTGANVWIWTHHHIPLSVAMTTSTPEPLLCLPGDPNAPLQTKETLLLMSFFICQTNSRELSITICPSSSVQAQSKLRFSMDRTVCFFSAAQKRYTDITVVSNV